MEEKIIAQGTIVELIPEIMKLDSPNDGFYELYAPVDAKTLLPEMLGAIVLTPHDADESPLVTDEHGNVFASVGDSEMLQDIIQVAQQDKADVSGLELVKAIDYYLRHDAYMSFEG